MKNFFAFLLAFSILPCYMSAETFELIKYGDFEQWVTRNVKESSVIGGNTKQIYEIAPTAVIDGDKPYVNQGGSPWGTSNVLAKVMGVTKTSNAVFPDDRSSGNRCCKMTTMMESCKAIGMINVEVVVAGAIFLGKMYEPIKSTKSPYGKMEMGVPFTRRPKALKFDYKLYVPDTNQRIYSSGTGSKKTLEGSDCAEVFIFLQRRWEDEKGNIYAKRVGTGRHRFSKTTANWVNGYQIPVLYGDITSNKDYRSYMGLIPLANSYYAKNSKGKMVPIQEIGWDDADATPTHLVVMASSGSGEAYIGTIGLTMWIDNVGLVY